MKALIATICLALSGCVTSYHHLSNPTVADDGYDLLCGGWKLGSKLSAKVSMCKNVAPYGGEFVLVDVEYNWKGAN